MKKFFLVGALTAGLIGGHMQAVEAGEIDVLVDLLVEKGIISPAEARIVVDEAKHRVAKEAAEGKTVDVPSWVQKLKFEQDLRLRYQYSKNSPSRNRGRIRYRLGVESKIAEQVKIAAGLATGSDDPRSTNQTFQDTFSSKGINLDYAYAQYTPFDGVELYGGKIKTKPVLWTPTDLLWDGDINPEGFGLHAEKDLVDNISAFLNANIWFIDESSATNDPWMHIFQGGLEAKEDIFDAKVAGTYYGFNSLRGACPNWTSGSNTGVTATSGGGCTGALMYDYDAVGISGELGVQEPFDLPVERAAFFGDYINNVSDGVAEDQGYAFGIKFGDKKVKDKGSWQGKYIYADLDMDAFPDAFPDSDRKSGTTGVRSNEWILNYALRNNVVLGLDLYRSETKSSSAKKETLLQADVVFSF